MQASFRTDFLIAVTAALLSSSALFLIWEGRAGEEQDRATGELLAELAARASIDGLIDQDRIELGVVANRLTGVPRVAGVAVFTVENDLLAVSGTLEDGTPFVHPIVLDDMLLGFARISLVPPAMAPDWMRFAFSVVALLAAALLVSWWSSRMRGATPATAVDPATEPVSATESVTRYLLVGNLHNQLSLTGSERGRATAQALAVARQVAGIYRCRSMHLPGTGLLMTFPAPGGDDTAFEAVCAAFLVAQCLDREASPGDYRFGLHALELQGGKSPADYPGALEDGALLAAMGRSGTVVASEAFFGHLAEPERLEAEAFSHSMLEELHSSDRQCHLITKLDGDRQALIGRQASRLSTGVGPQ